jgi:MFS superfamily sulfate permease-like transporter
MAPFAVLAVVVALALLSVHPHIAWVPVLALVAVRLLAGGRRWDGRASR